MIPYAIVVGCQFLPIDIRTIPEGRGRQARDDRRLTQKMLRRRTQKTTRRLDHRHRILRGHELRARHLHVNLRASQTRQNQSLFTGDQMRAIEFRRNVRG